MAPSQLRLLDSLLQDAVALRKATAQAKTTVQAQLVCQYSEENQQRLTVQLAVQSALLKQFIEKQEDERASNRQKSSSLNVFRQFGVGETMHSYLLADLLSPYGAHGQGHLFLNLFLDRIGICRKGDDEPWSVTAEKHRVDILLFRLDPPATIIVENKSNNAGDQPHQLYRYWYSHIYSPILRRTDSHAKALAPPPTQYQIYYLTPDGSKEPANDSLTRPHYLPDTLPDKLPLEVRSLTFRADIVAWLKAAIDPYQLPSVSLGNIRLREYLHQYIELWTSH